MPAWRIERYVAFAARASTIGPSCFWRERESSHVVRAAMPENVLRYGDSLAVRVYNDAQENRAIAIESRLVSSPARSEHLERPFFKDTVPSTGL